MIRDLPEDRLVKEITEAQSFLRDIKNAQFIGADNLDVKKNFSEATYDKSVTLDQAENTIITVNFEADKQDHAFASIDFVLYRDGTDPANAISHWDGATAIIGERITEESNPRLTTWEIHLESNVLGAHTYYLKIFVESTDTGVIS